MLWQYSHWARGGRSPSVKRSIALGGELLYLPTSDGRIVALDVRTGDVVWDRQVSDDERYGMTAGPLVAQGKVMIGTTGRAPGGNYIVGLDAATGEEMWRWWTIARPGEPGGESWKRAAAGGTQRRIDLGSWDLRCRARSGVFRSGANLRYRTPAGIAQGSGRNQRCIVYQHHRSTRSGYRGTGLVLPAPPQRPMGPGLDFWPPRS